MKKMWVRVVLLALLLCRAAHADVTFPPWTQPVIDLTGTLEPVQIQTLNRRLAVFEASKGSQIGVLMLPTTQPETIEQLGIRVFDDWRLGRKGVDDGVLLLVAKDDDRWRIEVGYGLEGALTDVTATRIARDVIFPYFKRGEYYEGIDAGVAAIARVIESEPLPPPAQHAYTDLTSSNNTLNFIKLSGVVLIVFMGFIVLSRYTKRQKAGSSDSGGGKSGAGRASGDY